MADYKIAYDITIKLEGYYSNVKGDRGGETYRGISRRWFPFFRGWKIVDDYRIEIGRELRRNERVPSNELDNLIFEFYLVNFWYKIKGDKIDFQKIANFLFDWTVTNDNNGIIAVQRLTKCKVDGIVGNETLNAINSSKNLLSKLIAVRIDEMEADVRKHPMQKKFEDGWRARIKSFKQ